MIRLHARPHPLPSTNCLSFSVFPCVVGPACWREWWVRGRAWSRIIRPQEKHGHRFNMELDLKRLFGLHVHRCSHWLRQGNLSHPSHFSSYTRALLVSQPRRHRFVTLWAWTSMNGSILSGVRYRLVLARRGTIKPLISCLDEPTLCFFKPGFLSLTHTHCCWTRAKDL